jgi:hypothetical protein
MGVSWLRFASTATARRPAPAPPPPLACDSRTFTSPAALVALANVEYVATSSSSVSVGSALVANLVDLVRS